MQQKYYTIAFVDKTEGGTFSNAKIVSGANNKTANWQEEMATQAGKSLSSKAIGMVSSGIGINVSPLVNVGKGFYKNSISKGAGTGLVVGAGLAIAEQAISFIVNIIQTKVNELRQEAAQANERDNALVLAGSLDLSGYTIRKGKWGRDEYVYSRG